MCVGGGVMFIWMNEIVKVPENLLFPLLHALCLTGWGSHQNKTIFLYLNELPYIDIKSVSYRTVISEFGDLHTYPCRPKSHNKVFLFWQLLLEGRACHDCVRYGWVDSRYLYSRHTLWLVNTNIATRLNHQSSSVFSPWTLFKEISEEMLQQHSYSASVRRDPGRSSTECRSKVYLSQKTWT